MRKTKSAGGIVVSPLGKILVVEQRGNSWSLPKGHLENGETDLEAAKREIYEESGVSILKLVKKLGSYKRFKIRKDGKGEDKSEEKTITMFLFTTSQMDLKPMDVNNTQALWVDEDEVVSRLTHPKDHEFFESKLGEIVFVIGNIRQEQDLSK